MSHNPPSILSGLFVNLHRIPAGEISSLQPTSIADGLLMWPLPGCTLWLRPDQLNEMIAKLAVHLPEAPVRAVLREYFGLRHTLDSDLDADLPVRREPEVAS